MITDLEVTMAGQEFIRLEGNRAESPPKASLSVTSDFSFVRVSMGNLQFISGKIPTVFIGNSLLRGHWSRTRPGLNPGFAPQQLCKLGPKMYLGVPQFPYLLIWNNPRYLADYGETYLNVCGLTEEQSSQVPASPPPCHGLGSKVRLLVSKTELLESSHGDVPTPWIPHGLCVLWGQSLTQLPGTHSEPGTHQA